MARLIDDPELRATLGAAGAASTKARLDIRTSVGALESVFAPGGRRGTFILFLNNAVTSSLKNQRRDLKSSSFSPISGFPEIFIYHLPAQRVPRDQSCSETAVLKQPC